MVDQGRGTRRAGPARVATERAQLGVIVLLACWVILPFLQTGTLAEDAIPFIAAVRVHDADATGIYSEKGDADVPAPLVEAGCPLAPAGTNCDHFILPFFSPPQVLPVMKVVDLLGDTGALLALRLLGALSYAGGMWLLWRRITPTRPEAAVPLFATTLLLTPFVYTTTAFGQNSPLMFLSACIGLSQADRPRRALGAAAAWVGTVIFKLFPLPLLLLAVLRRRWSFVAFALGLLALLTLASLPVAPSGAYGEFVATTRALTESRVLSPWNVSIDAFIHLFDASWRGSGAVFYAVEAARVAAIGGLAVWKLRDADEDVQWAYAWLALLAVHPQVWWHYFALVVPAVALALASAGRRDAPWWILPGAALAILPMALVTDERTLTMLGPVLVVAAVVLVPFLVRPATEIGAARRSAAPIAPPDR